MAKDRERVCRWYKNENNCSKGHAGTFNKACQKCKDYEPGQDEKYCTKYIFK